MIWHLCLLTAMTFISVVSTLGNPITSLRVSVALVTASSTCVLWYTLICNNNNQFSYTTYTKSAQCFITKIFKKNTPENHY